MTKTEEVEGKEVRIDSGPSRLSTDDESLNIPFRSYRVVDGGLVLLTKEVGPVDDGAFTVPREARNVVRLDPALELDWIVDADEDHARSVDGYRHRQFFCVADRLITRADSRRFFEVDPATGAIEDSWPPDAFVIGGERHELKYPVAHVDTAGDRRFVAANGPEFGSVVYAFDADGAQLWQRAFGKELLDLTASGDTVTAVRVRAKNSVLNAGSGELAD